MGKLWGNQSKFDKNGDGRLGASEWHDWYYRTYGHDIEVQETRAAARAEAQWEDWLLQAATVIQNAADLFLEAAETLLPSVSRAAAWQAFLCQVMAGLKEGNLWNEKVNTGQGVFVNQRIFYPYRALAHYLTNRSGQCRWQVFESAASRRGWLFYDVGQLSEGQCGSFWQEVIEQLPPYNVDTEPEMQDGELVSLSYAPDFPPEKQAGLEKLLTSLLPVGSFFAGAKQDAADRRNTRLLTYFVHNWKRMRGTYATPSDFPGMSVKRLQQIFPPLREWSIEELAEGCGQRCMEEMYRYDPERTLELWRSRIHTEEPIRDKKKAEEFFYQLEDVWYDGEDHPETLRPVLEALRSETFAKQMFQSAYVNYFHQNIIYAARACGQDALADHCLDLLTKNPLAKKRWDLSEYDIEEMYSGYGRGILPQTRNAAKSKARSASVREDPLPEDGTVFRYCTVKFQDVPRVYAYLTGNLPLKVGDWVEVPFGKENRTKVGQISSVTDCTRRTAPWPPEQTKAVLCLVEPPICDET